MTERVVWRPLFQQTIDAFHAGDLDAGQAACDRVLALDGVPAEYRVHAARNAVFYARPLAELVPGTAMTPVEVAVPPGWSRYNPSLCADPAGDGFRMVLRSANYTVTPQLDYATADPDGVFRTVNRLVALDHDLNVTGVELIDDTAEGLVVTGVPDGVRIIVSGQDLVRDGETVAVKDAPAAAAGN